jgi:catechol 2,3-dioxygenase-like lactoylglutathione lyase family enzyme
MGRVTGLGGVFFKSDDPEGLYAWYETHLGLKRKESGVFFRWRDIDDQTPGTTVWAIFKKDTKYFDPSRAPFMLNYRVDKLDPLLERLRAEGVQVDERREDSEYGRFAWVTDPDGNRIELWEPPAGS